MSTKTINYSIVNAEATALSVVPVDVHCNHGTHLSPRWGENIPKNIFNLRNNEIPNFHPDRSFIDAGMGLESESTMIEMFSLLGLIFVIISVIMPILLLLISPRVRKMS